MADTTAESTSGSSSVVAPPRVLCTVCNHRYAIYTCPRCATRTCSLPCSSAHKARTACSGERDKAAYVPMNRYGWGTMMDDYAFLEDVGRKVGDWGSEIARGKFQAAGSGNDRGARGRGRGGGGSRARGMQLEARDIEMDILPAGMERHKVNQSTWDTKNQTALLTIEFKFHPPPNPLALPSQLPEPPHTLLTHRNNLETPLLTLLQTHVADRKEGGKGGVPAWVRALIASPDSDADPDAWTPPQCIMSAPAALDPLTPAASSLYKQKQKQQPRRYYRLDCAKSLAELLRHTHFVEFPTIEVWEEFRGTVVDAAGAVTQTAQDDDEERAPKRRRLDRKTGGKKIAGLLDGYGSSSEEEGGSSKQPNQNGLEMLGGYEGSDDEDAQMPMQEEILGDSDAEEEVELDPAALLELVRKARGDENWTPQLGDEDADLVDWGDSDQET
ncbi:Box C/D snoRNA protein 1 [Mycena venus]|uniref:Box C/D snoRNA protein 1 n=1 Tax=Mycena venus TaxID=2733690 RepID=A0A8H6Y6Z0_9AGAR|nr:Box C/D snoRNA protein 1 [Mycena venus]